MIQKQIYSGFGITKLEYLYSNIDYIKALEYCHKKRDSRFARGSLKIHFNVHIRRLSS